MHENNNIMQISNFKCSDQKGLSQSVSCWLFDVFFCHNLYQTCCHQETLRPLEWRVFCVASQRMAAKTSEPWHLFRWPAPVGQVLMSTNFDPFKEIQMIPNVSKMIQISQKDTQQRCFSTHQNTSKWKGWNPQFASTFFSSLNSSKRPRTSQKPVTLKSVSPYDVMKIPKAILEPNMLEQLKPSWKWCWGGCQTFSQFANLIPGLQIGSVSKIFISEGEPIRWGMRFLSKVSAIELFQRFRRYLEARKLQRPRQKLQVKPQIKSIEMKRIQKKATANLSSNSFLKSHTISQNWFKVNLLTKQMNHLTWHVVFFYSVQLPRWEIMT